MSQVGFTATPPAVNLIASGAPVVVIAGMPNQDWLIASDEVKTCKDLKGKTIAADGINNARTLFLQSVLESCGVKLSRGEAHRPCQPAAGQGRPSPARCITACGTSTSSPQVEHKTGKKWALIHDAEGASMRVCTMPC